MCSQASWGDLRVEAELGTTGVTERCHKGRPAPRLAAWPSVIATATSFPGGGKSQRGGRGDRPNRLPLPDLVSYCPHFGVQIRAKTDVPQGCCAQAMRTWMFVRHCLG